MNGAERENQLPSSLDIIFSCSICQATLSEIYGHPDSSQGVRDGRSSERIVTKLWLTDCAHLTCSKHLEGGGAPFHPEGTQPRAPCPLCLQEKGDSEPKGLYGIRGCSEGAYDKAIPKSWFDAPPIKLDASGPGMEALRFQYLSLMRFGTMTYRKLRELQRGASRSNKTIAQLESTKQSLEDELRSLRTRVKSLEKAENELKQWKKREPSIKHYLGVVSSMAKENDLLKEQLVHLGYAVPQTSYAMKPDSEPQTADDRRVQNGIRSPEDVTMVDKDAGRNGKNRTGSHHYVYRLLRSGNPANEKNPERHQPSPTRDELYSGTKRNYAEYIDLRNSGGSRPGPLSRTLSRDLMPPPALPPMRRPVEVLPRPGTAAEGVFSSSRHQNGDPQPPVALRRPSNVELYENGQWHSLGHQDHAKREQVRLSSAQDGRPWETATMSGGLPPRNQTYTSSARQDMPQASLSMRNLNVSSKLSTVETRGFSAEERNTVPFLQPLNRSSTRPGARELGDHEYGPVRHALYARQGMDGRMPRQYLDDRGGDTDGVSYQPPLRTFSPPAPSRQPLDVPLARDIYRQPNLQPLRAYPTPSSRLLSARGHNTHVSPVTPPPHRQANIVRESVASPFFRAPAQARPAPHNLHSINARPGTVQHLTQGYKMAPARTDWNKPRSLNGLSFISEPHNIENEPVYQPHTRYRRDWGGQRPLMVPSTPRDEDGLFRRPDVPPSPHVRGQVPPPSAKGGYGARQVGPLPAAMPSGFGPPLSARTYPRDDPVSAVRGAKSGTARISQGGYSGVEQQSSRGLFSSAGGRRSVRR